MCAIESYSTAIVVLFLAAAFCMAVLSRKLNDHLLVPPEPDKHIIFRRKHFVRPSFFLKPDQHFDRTGQQIAWRVTVLAAIAFAAFLAIVYVNAVCRQAVSG